MAMDGRAAATLAWHGEAGFRSLAAASRIRAFARWAGTVLLVLLAYVALALAFSFPLPLHLSTHLLGDPGGDTGTYAWNMWVFRHELIHHRSPFFTSTLFAPFSQPAGLSLHNYTVFADLVALPLQRGLGLVATFNLIYIVVAALNGLALFLLARHLTRDPAAAFLAGIAFAFSSFLVTRGTAHFSLATAAAVPTFVLAVVRARETRQRRYAVGAGLALAWALFSDPYYAVFCVLIGSWLLGHATLETSRAATPPGATHRRLTRAVEITILLVAALTLAIALSGGRDLALGSRRVFLRTLFTPMLALTLLMLLWWAMRARPRVRLREGVPWARTAALLGLAAGTTAVLAAPFLYALFSMLASGAYVEPRPYWRTGPPGVDLLAFLIPNPNHPWWGGLGQGWLSRRPNGYVENVASQSLTVAVVILLGARWRARALPRVWVAMTAFFGLLALGPFVRVATVNTCIPTPWALLRYLPVVGNARSPSRFAMVVTLGLALLFAYALSALATGARRRVTLGVVGALLLLELTPVPRRLFDVRIPAFYERVARDTRDVTVLELPFGVRSGASNVGGFSAFSQFCQTRHGKRLFGGYLSRVEDERERAYRRQPFLDALLTLSSGAFLTPEQAESARADRRRFRQEARLGYVVIDTRNASWKLKKFAINMLWLEKVDEDGPFELYVPAAATDLGGC